MEDTPAGVWGVVATLVPESELPELRRRVEAGGEDLVRNCADLRNEADALRAIVEEYATANAAEAATERSDAEAADEKRRAAQTFQLGDGPEREMHERKIGMLLEYLSLGEPAPGAEARVVRHLRRSPDDSNDAPTRAPGAPPCTPPRAPRTAERAPSRGGEVKALRGSLKVETFDEAASEVRRLLETEAADLLAEIDRLAETFDAEEALVVERKTGKTPEKERPRSDRPTMDDLRQVGKRLEERWLRSEHRRDVRGVLARARAPDASPVAFGKSSLVGELVSSLSPEPPAPPPGRSTAAGGTLPPPRRAAAKSKSKLRARLRDAREETFLQDW